MSDLISRQAAIDALARMMPRSYTPDGSHPADEEIFRAQEVFADCIEALEILPSAQPATNCSEFPNNSDAISRQAAIDDIWTVSPLARLDRKWIDRWLRQLPPIQPEPKRGKWILDRSGAYCCSECMEPCASYVMMKPRDKFCKMCGSRNEVTT